MLKTPRRRVEEVDELTEVSRLDNSEINTGEGGSCGAVDQDG